MDNRLRASLNKRITSQNLTPRWFKHSFPQQINYINDKSRLKAAKCTRRAGKSYAAGIQACKDAYENPGCNILYIALSVESARRIIWKDVLKAIDREHSLGIDFKETSLTAVLPNGSTIYLIGADAKPDEMLKLLGMKNKFVIIDEASKYHVDVKKMVYDVLLSTVTDLNGQISLIGTTDNFVKSFFALVTLGKEPGWSVHGWAALDNPYVGTQVKAEMAEHRRNNPKVDEEPWFRQNYLAMWDVDTRVLMYRYSKDKIESPWVPELSHAQYTLAIKISPLKQITGFAVAGFGDDDACAYIFEAYSQPTADIGAVIEECLRLGRSYDLGAILCVGASSSLVDDLRRRFPISVEDVSEKDSGDKIQLMNTDLLQDRIKVIPGNTDKLLEEWDSVIKDDRAPRGILREHPLSPSQIATATLYAWSRCHNYAYEPATTSEDIMDEYWAQQHERIRSEEFEEFH